MPERALVRRVEAKAYRIPTDRPESDGTLAWDSTTVVVARVEGGGRRGLGYSYTDAAAAELVRGVLARAVEGRDALDVPGSWWAMWRAARNLGRSGLVAAALSALDVALWDLKARLLDRSLVDVLGVVRPATPVYGSGGFTSYTLAELEAQLAGWVAEGIPRVKMKVGRDPEHDPERVRAARRAIGPDAELFVDANGAFDVRQALFFAERFAEQGVTWFEEPVPQRDHRGLHRLRERAPAGMDVAAGEYGYVLDDFRALLEAGAVDVLQADATRCGGISGFLRVGTLCDAFSTPLSAHTAPTLHAHVCAALRPVRHIEYFHDHARIERLIFDGALSPDGGELRPHRDRPGLGLELREAEARRYAL